MSVFEVLLWIAQSLRPFSELLQLLSYVIGPLFAIVAFYLNRKDRRQIIEQAKELGRAQEAANRARDEASRAREEAAEQADQASKLRGELEGITKGSDQLWKLRPARPFDKYREWYNLREGATLVTIGNLKGGVGKTTISANFAAYLSETLHKRVLLVDLDYQGSLSTLMLLPLQREEEISRVEQLFGTDADLAVVQQARVHLVPEGSDVTTQLTRGWIVPAGYTFAQTENQLLLTWLLNQDGVDVRYRLAHSLLAPQVRRDYDVIIFDMPPRMTLGAVNAIVASHYFFVPSDLGKLSAEAVPQFISNLKAIKADLNLGIELGGLIGTLTRQVTLSRTEQLYLDQVREAGRLWSKERDFVLPQTVPRRASISDVAGEEYAYLQSDAARRTELRNLLDPLFAEMCQRMRLGS